MSRLWNTISNLFADTVGGVRLVCSERTLLAALIATIIFNFFGFCLHCDGPCDRP